MESRFKHFRRSLEVRVAKDFKDLKKQGQKMVVTLETGQALFVWPCLEIERYNEYQAKKSLKLQDNISEQGFVRNIEADGNCFYKAVLFKYFENLCRKGDQNEHLQLFIIKQAKNKLSIIASRTALKEVKHLDKIIHILEIIYYFIENGDLHRAFDVFVLHFSGETTFSNGIIEIFRIRLAQFIEHLKTTHPDLHATIMHYGTIEDFKQKALFPNEYAQGVLVMLVAHFLRQHLIVNEIVSRIDHIQDENGKFKVLEQYGERQWPQCLLLLSNQHYFLIESQISHHSPVKKHFDRTESILQNLLKVGYASVILYDSESIEEEEPEQSKQVETYKSLPRESQFSEQIVEAPELTNLKMEEEVKDQRAHQTDYSTPNLSKTELEVYQRVKRYYLKMHWNIEYEEPERKMMLSLHKIIESMRLDVKGTNQSFLDELVFLQKEIAEKITKSESQGCAHSLNSLRQGLDSEELIKRKMGIQRCPICEGSYRDPKKQKLQKEISKSALDQSVRKFSCSRCLNPFTQKLFENLFEQDHSFFQLKHGQIYGPLCPHCHCEFKTNRIPVHIESQLQFLKEKMELDLQRHEQANILEQSCAICKLNLQRVDSLKAQCGIHKFHQNCIINYVKKHNTLFKDDNVYCPLCYKVAFNVCSECKTLKVQRLERCQRCNRKRCQNCISKHFKKCHPPQHYLYSKY